MTAKKRPKTTATAVRRKTPFATSSRASRTTKTLHAFDLDHTLVDHDENKPLMVNVLNMSGEVVARMTFFELTQREEFRRLHTFDWSEWTSAAKFADSALPNGRVLRRFRSALQDGHDTVIVTARSDMDCRLTFARALRRFGIDFIKTHVYRVGSIRSSGTTSAARKAIVMTRLIREKGYSVVHFYDDDKRNLEAIRRLRFRFPRVRFHLFLVEEGRLRKYS